MLTSVVLEAVARDDRAPYRPFAVRVDAVRRVTANVARVTFRGPELAWFGTGGLDQRVKLLFPLPGAPVAAVAAGGPDGDWYARWLALPPAHRNPMRTFTVRAVRPRRRELDVDFALHPATAASPHGPAARWIADARPGDPLTVVGPDARSLASSSGIAYRPGRADRVLLVGDETALPAIGAIVATPGAAPRASVLLELADVADVGALDTTGGADVRVVVRDPAAPGDGLLTALRDWVGAHAACVRAAAAPQPQPLDDGSDDLLWETGEGGDGSLYAWLAGEAGIVRRLRRTLVGDVGVDRSRVSFMGYWRRGRAEGC